MRIWSQRSFDQTDGAREVPQSASSWLAALAVLQVALGISRASWLRPVKDRGRGRLEDKDERRLNASRATGFEWTPLVTRNRSHYRTRPRPRVLFRVCPREETEASPVTVKWLQCTISYPSSTCGKKSAPLFTMNVHMARPAGDSMRSARWMANHFRIIGRPSILRTTSLPLAISA